ncbi:MAG: serine--tRNA ligase [Deltaproteobacteria bacterium]|nr:serine--tRNA ligase [Deltaproteobacteria bacterium]
MLDVKNIRQNFSLIKKGLENRNADINLEELILSDDKRKEILFELEELRYKRNSVSDKIAELKRAKADANSLILEMREVSARIKTLEKDLSDTEAEINKRLIVIPNIPHSSAPVGKNEADNKLVKKEGTPKNFDFEPKAHWDIGEALNILDFERAAKITGARFPLYYGAGARLERALINFMLDIHTIEHGYKETLPPFIVNRNSMTATGQLPKFEEDLFKIKGTDYFLIPTAEVPVTNIYNNEILAEANLPILHTAYTPCFRSEAGAYGKDTRGLIRQHQFNKVELVKFVKPEDSYAELETLLKNAEEILKRLKIPYRVVTLCTGDLGFSAAKTYDIEVWMPAQGVYREISSCSNFEDFQARRANIRFKREGKKKTEFIHTLNGSGLAVGRTFAAILENFQQADGSVTIPEALVPYMNGIKKIGCLTS